MKDETGFFPKVPHSEIDKSSNDHRVRERVILIRKQYPHMTLATIGWNVGVTRQRVSQILKGRQAMKTILKIQCMHCRKDMGEKDGKGTEGTSHSICKECWMDRYPQYHYPDEKEGGAEIMSIEELRTRIEGAAKKLGLDADKLRREYGTTTALAEMLERQIVAEQSK